MLCRVGLEVLVIGLGTEEENLFGQYSGASIEQSEPLRD